MSRQAISQRRTRPRTETTFHNTLDFQIGKRLHNLPALREVGFRANRRLLDVPTSEPRLRDRRGEFRQLTQPIDVEGQRASALRYADPCVLALFSALLVFRLLPRGFACRELREHLAPLLGEPPSALTQGRMSYQLRRLRLHGLIVRQPKSHRYEVTSFGLRMRRFSPAVMLGSCDQVCQRYSNQPCQRLQNYAVPPTN